MSFKFTVELGVMTMKSDTKIQEELTCYFKIDMNFTNFDIDMNFTNFDIDMNFTNFDLSTQKVKFFFV